MELPLPSDPGSAETKVVHWILDHPKLWGIVTLIAIAIGFSPRVSALGVWICLVLAEVTAVAFALSIAEKRGQSRLGWTVGIGVFGVVGLVALGWWLVQEKMPAPRDGMKAEIEEEATFKPRTGQGTGLVLWATIWNLGPPSAVNGYHLSAELADGRMIEAVTEAIFDDFMSPSGIAPRRVFHKEDALYNKTVIPIPTGGQVSGMLSFTLPNLTHDEVWKEGVKLHLRFTDVRNETYSVDVTLRDLDKNAGFDFYVPGTLPSR
jgi:hypothetical protein